jgi:hypothetical protein
MNEIKFLASDEFRKHNCTSSSDEGGFEDDQPNDDLIGQEWEKD